MNACLLDQIEITSLLFLLHHLFTYITCSCPYIMENILYLNYQELDDLHAIWDLSHLICSPLLYGTFVTLAGQLCQYVEFLSP